MGRAVPRALRARSWLALPICIGLVLLSLAGSARATGARARGDARRARAAATTYRPDAQIRLSTKPTYLGNDTYNGTGSSQTAKKTTRPGVTTTFVLKVQNDGKVSDTYTVKGPGNAPGRTMT